MAYINPDTGWAVVSSGATVALFKTINSGLNWTQQSMPIGNTPYGGTIVLNSVTNFLITNRDTLYGVGGIAYFPTPNYERGLIWKTINSGINWGFQLPDTSFPIDAYQYCSFINSQTGWVFANQLSGVYTTSGGGPIYYTGIEHISSSLPKHFMLEQNYPNPFNPSTTIEFSINKRSQVLIIISDVLGRVVETLVSQELNAGTYKITWDASKYSSGIYYYTLILDKYRESRKMVYLK